MRYVSIFRRPSNTAIGRKGRFRMDTSYIPLLAEGQNKKPALTSPATFLTITHKGKIKYFFLILSAVSGRNFL